MDCNKKCHVEGGCPFAMTGESEQIQNYGCLPTPNQILHMKIVHDKNWACHDDPSKPCMGALEYFKQNKIPSKVTFPLITEKDDWHLISGGSKDPVQKELAIKQLNWPYRKFIP